MSMACVLQEMIKWYCFPLTHCLSCVLWPKYNGLLFLMSTGERDWWIIPIGILTPTQQLCLEFCYLKHSCKYTSTILCVFSTHFLKKTVVVTFHLYMYCIFLKWWFFKILKRTDFACTGTIKSNCHRLEKLVTGRRKKFCVAAAQSKKKPRHSHYTIVAKLLR